MSEFLNEAFTFPTAIFSTLLIPVLLYWISVILGAADLDLLDGLFEGVDSGLEGGFDGGLDTGLDGFDADVDVDLDVDGHHGGDGVLAMLGLAGVPLSISLSLLIFFGWFLTFGGIKLFGHLTFGILTGTLLTLLICGLATIVSFVLTSAAASQLRPAFTMRGAIGRHDLVNKICTVTTQRVDGNFGQAEITDEDGAILLVQVRNAGEAPFQKGQKALIYRYQKDREVFWISALDPEFET